MFIQPQTDAAPAANAPLQHVFTPHAKLAHAPLFSATRAAFAGGSPLVSSFATMTPPTTRFEYSSHFVDTLNQAIVEALETKTQGALLVVQLTNFAMVLDALGREPTETAVGELILALQQLLPAAVCVERLHRDQIGVILTAVTQQETHQAANAILRTVQNFGTSGDDAQLHLTCSIGSTEFPQEKASAQDLLDKAYVALNSSLYQPHKTGHFTYHNTHEQAATSRQQLGLANYLRRAIKDNKLRLAFQPVITARTGEVHHYEALLRVIGEDGKISSAGPLIPVAEQMGMIELIDHLVLDMVIQELEESPDVRLAMNVSNLTTENHSWLEQIRYMLRSRPDIASRIIVEITETAAHHDMRQVAYFVASLQELGCSVALDDFGSGYTSFRQLKSLSVDSVKIDGVYIKDIVENPDSRLFVKTLLEFTQAYGLESVAEFVENGEIAKILMDLGVDHLQGYYFGKPQNFRSWVNPTQL